MQSFWRRRACYRFWDGHTLEYFLRGDTTLKFNDLLPSKYDQEVARTFFLNTFAAIFTLLVITTIACLLIFFWKIVLVVFLVILFSICLAGIWIAIAPVKKE